MFDCNVKERETVVRELEALIGKCQEKDSGWYQKAKNILTSLKEALVKIAEEDFLTAIDFFWTYLLPQAPQEILTAL